MLLARVAGRVGPLAIALACICPLPAQGPFTIHQYADAAACQMGGREANYLPSGIVPGGEKIPVYWNGLELSWKQINAAAGIGEFQATDPVTGVTRAVGGGFPDADAIGVYTNPNGRSTAGASLRCDNFPYVEASCIPDQFIREVKQGSCTAGPNKGAACLADANCPGSKCEDPVHWHILFRRKEAAARNTCNNLATWGPDCKDYYRVVDAVGMKEKSFGTVWLDGLAPNKSGQNFTFGFRAGPMPRPGGKRPGNRAEGRRATQWFDLPSTMVAGACNDCHSTPFNGSDWIRESKLDFSGDDAMPWWHAGNEKIGFPDKTFFKAARRHEGVGMVTNFTCDSSCHKQWMKDSRGTPGAGTPAPPGDPDGFPFARFMTMVHQNTPGNPFNGLSRYHGLASATRRDDGTAYADKDAKKTHMMPSPNREAKVKNWVANWGERYTMLACCGANMNGTANELDPTVLDRLGTPGQPRYTNDVAGLSCERVSCTEEITQTEVKPAFKTPWMAANGFNPAIPPKANGVQQILAPDTPAGVTLTLMDCQPPTTPAAVNAGDKCYRLAWSDPNGSPFNAPQTFHYSKLPNKRVTDADWTAQAIGSTQFCTDLPDSIAIQAASTIFPNAKETQIPAPAGADNWRFSYETFGLLPKCEKMALRLCGGWCSQKIQRSDQLPILDRVSAELGQLLTLWNDGDADVTNQFTVTRLGFRKNNTTGRYHQSITLTNRMVQSFPAPIRLVLINLSANATLYNASNPGGSPPFINVMPPGDAPQFDGGSTVTVALEFTNPTNGPINYTLQLIAPTITAACR